MFTREVCSEYLKCVDKLDVARLDLVLEEPEKQEGALLVGEGASGRRCREAVQRSLVQVLEFPAFWQQLRRPQLLQSVCGNHYHRRVNIFQDVFFGHLCSLVARMPFLLAWSPFMAFPTPPPFTTSPISQSSETRE